MCITSGWGLSDPITPTFPGAGFHPVSWMKGGLFALHRKANGIELWAAHRVAAKMERLSRPQFHGIKREATVVTKKNGKVTASNTLNSSSPSLRLCLIVMLFLLFTQHQPAHGWL
jgi:hypothetical protein